MAIFSLFFIFFINFQVQAVITPSGPYLVQALSDPDPPVFTWNSSLAYYDNHLIYAGSQGIFAYNLDTETTTLVSDLSSNPNFSFGPAGFLVTDDRYLYFTDNGSTTRLYRVLLTNNWPLNYENFDTQSNGSIFSLTQNPWTSAVWFATADLGDTNMYLYEVKDSFSSVEEKASFEKSHGVNAGNGPIIFKDETNLLYGESVWASDGYFHLLDISTGSVTQYNYIIFNGGLVAASYGYEGSIFVTTGNGSAVQKLENGALTTIAEMNEDAQGIVFDGTSFFISQQTSSDSSGEISFNALWRLKPSGGGGGCFINSLAP